MMMGGSMMGGAAVVGALMMLVFVVVIAGLMWLVGSAASPGSQFRTSAFSTETSLDVLKRRYAAGEITREDFEAARRQVSPAPDRSQPLLTAQGENNLELQQLHLERRRLLDQAAEAEEQARLAVPDEVQVRAYLEARQGALFRAGAIERLIHSMEDSLSRDRVETASRHHRKTDRRPSLSDLA